MTTAGSRWGVVMSRNAGYSDQVCNILTLFFWSCLIFYFFLTLTYLYFIWWFKVVELDFLYPSEGIHRRWENNYRITSMAATNDQAAFILSIPKRKLLDETQETLRTSAFPSTHVKVYLHLLSSIICWDLCILSILDGVWKPSFYSQGDKSPQSSQSTVVFHFYSSPFLFFLHNT